MNSQIKNKRLALITTWYPPLKGVAVGRMNAFSKYLSQDFEVEVFCMAHYNKTVKINEKLIIHYFRSNKLFEKIKSNQLDYKIIHNIKTLIRIIIKKITPNPLLNWKKLVLNALENNHSKNNFDLIISSFSPSEVHLVAIDFCIKNKKVIWIADMRDEMSSNPLIDINTKNNLKSIEKDIDMYATAILSVSEPILNEFKTICPTVKYFLEIRNGYDHQLVFKNSKKSNSKIINLGYFGSFYGLQKPDILFKALLLLTEENKNFDYQLNIYGAHNNFKIPLKLKDKIRMMPFISYENTIKKMNEMDSNILIIPSNGRKGVYSGKLFDYISAKKPILAFVDKEDVAAKLIIDLDCGYVAEFSDIEDNKLALMNFFNDNKKFYSKKASDIEIESLHRKIQVDKISKLINKLIVK